jgi:hypothetical protein
MHCPTCRYDNPATTRFCGACGAVLVESAPDGRRRRILRPWGMRRTAPPTISPDMPDLGDDQASLRPVADLSSRVDFWIVAGLVVAVIAATWLAGKVRPAGPESAAGVPAVAQRSPSYVTVAMPPIVQEARLKAPPLAEVPPAPPAPAPAKPRAAPAGPATVARAAPPVIVAAPPVDAASEPTRAEAAPLVVAAAPSNPPPATDRWQPLRSAVARCASNPGLIARAMCEQEARLAHCDGFWGVVPACPAQRTEYGQ